MQSYAPGGGKSSMDNHNFPFVLYNWGDMVVSTYKVQTCLLIIGVLLIGCLNDRQSGSVNVAEPTVTTSVQQPTVATRGTVTPTQTATKQPTATVGLLPTASSTSQASPVPTPTPLPSLVWAEDVEQVASIQGIDHHSVLWSPIANEFIAHDCLSALHNEVDQQSIYRVSAPEFSPADITPANFVCEPLQDMIWSADAAHILFSGPFPEDHPLHPSNYGWDNSAIWIMDGTGNNSHPLNLDQAYGRYLHFIDWMDERTLVYEYYAGGGHHHTVMLDVDSGEPISWAGVQVGGGYQPGLTYIGTNTGMTSGGNISAVAVSKTMVYSDTIFDGGPFLLCVSKSCYGSPPDNPPLLDSNSRFEDWLPGTNKMLLLTWKADGYLTEFDVETLETRLNRHIETQLQIWDVDAREVSPLVKPGIYGRFSADGQYLAFHSFMAASTSDEFDTQLHILRMVDKQIILSLPSAEPVIDYEDVPAFVWSPTSDRLIYRDEQDNWQVVQIPDGNRMPITFNGGARLSFPQWSSDGQYLSVIVRNESEGGTVILRVP